MMSDKRKVQITVDGSPVSVEATFEQVRAYMTRKRWAPTEHVMPGDRRVWMRGSDPASCTTPDRPPHELKALVHFLASYEQRPPADVLRGIVGLDAPRCDHCSEFGLRVKDGCLVYLWGKEEREQPMSREASVAAAREVLGTTAADARADEIEADVAKYGHQHGFDAALRCARYSRDGSQRAETPEARKRQQIDAAAWLIVAQRILAREAAR